MLEPNLKEMRFRNKGTSLSLVDSYTSDESVPLTEAFPPRSGSPFKSVAERKEHNMWDVVIKDFHARSAKGEIFNNPMVDESVHFSVKPLVDTYNLQYLTRGSEGQFDRGHKRRIVMDRIAVDENYVDNLRTLHAPLERLQNLAITAAYAGVTATEQNAILWLGEFRETVSMFKDIGTSLMELWKKTKKQRAAWAKGKLTVPEAQSLTLGILYGLVPLEQSIAQVMEGLFKLKDTDSRQTSRGFQLYTDQSDIVKERIFGHYQEGVGTLRYTESLEVLVRAGVLYDVDTSEFPTFLVVANPKAIIETAYALARLSFVIDWFINVGNTLAAWSPSTGTNILSAWVTISETYVIKGQDSQVIRAQSLNQGSLRITGGYNGQFPFEKTVVTKRRIPIDRSDLAILPRVNINLNIDKILAMVLLFAKAKKP